MIRILGCDPSTVATGYGVINVSNGIKTCIEAGVIDAPNGWPKSKRLCSIARELFQLVRDRSLFPEGCTVHVAAEDGVARYASAALAVGEARGLVIAAAASVGLRVVLYSPKTAKLAVAGNGAASKEQVATMVMRLLKMKKRPSLDASDALAIALTHATSVTRRAGMKASTCRDTNIPCA